MSTLVKFAPTLQVQQHVQVTAIQKKVGVKITVTPALANYVSGPPCKK